MLCIGGVNPEGRTSLCEDGLLEDRSLVRKDGLLEVRLLGTTSFPPDFPVVFLPLLPLPPGFVRAIAM